MSTIIVNHYFLCLCATRETLIRVLDELPNRWLNAPNEGFIFKSSLNLECIENGKEDDDDSNDNNDDCDDVECKNSGLYINHRSTLSKNADQHY